MIKEIANLFHDMTLYGLEKMGLYYSKYRGFVYDREDPKNLNRIKVYVPEIYGDQALEKWAWPASNYSGRGYGAQAIPRTNDLVWVEFEKGNPNKPLWSYGYFGDNEKPDELKGYNNYWFRTPNGLTVSMDDDNLITKITTPNGYSLEINEETESIKIISSENYQLLIDEAGIHLDGEVVYLNGDDEGGLVIAGKTTDKLNRLESEFNTLKNLFTTWVPIPSDGAASLKTIITTFASQPMTPTTEQEISNDKVKHG